MIRGLTFGKIQGILTSLTMSTEIKVYGDRGFLHVSGRNKDRIRDLHQEMVSVAKSTGKSLLIENDRYSIIVDPENHVSTEDLVEKLAVLYEEELLPENWVKVEVPIRPVLDMVFNLNLNAPWEWVTSWMLPSTYLTHHGEGTTYYVDKSGNIQTGTITCWIYRPEVKSWKETENGRFVPDDNTSSSVR